MAGFPILILICSFPGRVNEDKSQPQHQNPQVSCLHFQLSENQALLTPSRRWRWRGHPLPPGARAHPPQHFTPLKRLCPNCQRCVSNTALPENGSETLCNECRSRFQKGQHPTKRRVLSDTPTPAKRSLCGALSARLPKHTRRKVDSYSPVYVDYARSLEAGPSKVTAL